MLKYTLETLTKQFTFFSKLVRSRLLKHQLLLQGGPQRVQRGVAAERGVGRGPGRGRGRRRGRAERHVLVVVPRARGPRPPAPPPRRHADAAHHRS